MGLRSWLERRRLERAARKAVERAFRSEDLLRGTSLKRRHASRWVLVSFEAREGRLRLVRFGILRHPRPYGFSRQSHKVIEYYEYDLEGGRISRTTGHNITRASGRDADDR